MTSQAVSLLEEIKHLLELQGENPFKVRAFEKAAEKIADSKDLKKRAQEGTLTEIEGVGKGIAEVLTEFLLQGKCTLKDELLKTIPAGLLELTQIPGLGPKKAKSLITELEVHSLRELEYACKENRLAKLKGFGEKTQEAIFKEIQKLNSRVGKFLLGDVYDKAEKLKEILLETVGSLRLEETGELRRRCEVLTKFEYLIQQPFPEMKKKIETVLKNFQNENRDLPPVFLYEVDLSSFGSELIRTTGSDAHLKAAKFFQDASNKITYQTEEEFYEAKGLSWLPPEIRETGSEISLKQTEISKLLPLDGVQGVFHNHTTRSDGKATLEEMVLRAKALGYHYIGISDHSQSAFYAHGLKPEDLLTQEKEIRELQEKYPEIRIFWGVESDILADGSLDYEPEILKRFDFVIASVHSRFKMDRAAMTERLLSAVRNPYTCFLGHWSGRLLLGREGYEFDAEKVISAASKCGVAIELNAHPARLDIDWRYGDLLRKNKTWISINPDAHDLDGLTDVKYGVWMARKALLPSQQIVNTQSASEIEKWLKKN